MISPQTDDLLLIDNSVRDVVAQAEADAPAGAGLDEIIHGLGVEGVLSLHKSRVKHHVALLRERRVRKFGSRSHVFRSLVRTMPAAATAALRSFTLVSLLSEQNTP